MLQSKERILGNGRKRVSKRLAPILKGVRFLPFFFAKIAQGRLERHWTQTYTIIGTVSNAFIVLVTILIQPKLTTLEPKFTILAPLVGILTGFTVLEYRLFLGKVHERTVELADKGGCRLKLTILRVHMKRGLISATTFALNIAFAAFLLSGVTVPFLTAGIPYFFLLNVLYLFEFRLGKNKDVEIAFEGVQQLKALPTFYQTMTMRVIRDRIRKRLKQQIPLAGGIDPNPFLRWFYLDHVLPPTPTSQTNQVSAKLKDSLIQNGDLFGLLNQPYAQSANEAVLFGFSLPWEKRFNWGRLALVVVTLIDVLAALTTLRIIDALLKQLFP